MTGLERLRLGGLAAILLAACVWSLLVPSDDAAPDASAQASGMDEALAAFAASEAGAMAGPWTLSLPRDFGAHPEAASEAWSVAAHLQDPDGQAMSLTLVLTRLGVAEVGDAPAPWGPGPIHVAQAVLGAAAPGVDLSEDRVSRGEGTAGHDGRAQEIWVDDWSVAYGAEGLTITLRLGDTPLVLSLGGGKPPLTLTGEDTTGTRGFAIPRLTARGTLRSGTQAVPLTGTAWLDRLWGEVPLPDGPLVRDRLVLHLSDGSDLSILRTRRRDGRGIATLDAVLVGADGTARVVDDTTLSVMPGSAESGGAPESWRIAGEGLDLIATIPEASLTEGLGIAAWVGRLVVEGTYQGRPVGGAGTVLYAPGDAPGDAS